MLFKVLQEGSDCSGNKKFFIKEHATKANLVLDIGLPLYFKDKQRAEVVADMLNREFGGKR